MEYEKAFGQLVVALRELAKSELLRATEMMRFQVVQVAGMPVQMDPSEGQVHLRVSRAYCSSEWLGWLSDCRGIRLTGECTSYFFCRVSGLGALYEGFRVLTVPSTPSFCIFRI